jgi:hypothetical protein
MFYSGYQKMSKVQKPRKTIRNIPSSESFKIDSFILSYSCCSLCSIGHLWNASFHFSFLILDGRYDSLDGGSACHKAATCTGHHKQNKRTQTSIPWVGFEPTIPVFELAKTVHTLDRSSTVVSLKLINSIDFIIGLHRILKPIYLKAQLVSWLVTVRTAEGSVFESWQGQDFSPIHVIQTGSGAHTASCSLDTGGAFPGG